MSARRPPGVLLALLAGALGLALVVPPVRATPDLASPAAPGPGVQRSALLLPVPGGDPAVALLAAAARAAQQRTWSGTQDVSAAPYGSGVQPGAARLAVLDVRHSPATGLQITAAAPQDEDAADAATEVQTEVMDERLLDVLAATCQLRVARGGRYLGRPVAVVEAWRPGAATPAGRFWLDRASALVLRREVYDDDGTVLRSAAYASFDLAAGSGPARPAAVPSAMSSTALSGLAASVGVGAGRWTVPQALPGHLQLFDAAITRSTGVRVLHLAYSDGLSRLSLFAQAGRLGAQPPTGFVHQPVAGADSWVLAAGPERVVWTGGGTVWTLVSDAPAAVVQQVVGALPRDLPPDRGLLARLARGLSRVGSWLNPFA